MYDSQNESPITKKGEREREERERCEGEREEYVMVDKEGFSRELISSDKLEEQSEISPSDESSLGKISHDIEVCN